MMNKVFLRVALLSVLAISCRKQDYITGGQKENPKVNQTTYDYLKGNSMHLFDTLLLLVDAAGLKDTTNQSDPPPPCADGFIPITTLR